MQSPYLYSAIVLGVIAVGFGVRSFIRRRERWVKTRGWVEKCEAATLKMGKQHVPGVRIYYSFESQGQKIGGQVTELGFEDPTNIQAFLDWCQPESELVIRNDRKNPDRTMIDTLDNPKLAFLAGETYGWYGNVDYTPGD